MISRAVIATIGTMMAVLADIMPETNPWTTLGAAGVLATVLVVVIRDAAVARKERVQERKEEREVTTKMHDRLHGDSERLNETLRDLIAHCAGKRSGL